MANMSRRSNVEKQTLVEDGYSYAMHNDSGAMYRIEVLLGETFVDSSGKIHVTNEYTII